MRGKKHQSDKDTSPSALGVVLNAIAEVLRPSRHYLEAARRYHLSLRYEMEKKA